MRIMRLLCAAACVALTSCGPGDALDAEATALPSGPAPGSRPAAMCAPQAAPPKCVNDKVPLATGIGVLSDEHHVRHNEHMEGAILPCPNSACADKPLHGTKVWFKWNAWCVPNPNYEPGKTMPVVTENGLEEIQVPACLANAERVTQSLRGFNNVAGGDTRHYWNFLGEASCVFVNNRAAPGHRKYCTSKGAASLEIWPHTQFMPLSTNNNPYGSSVLLGVGYAAKHTDQPLTAGIDVGIIFASGPAGFIFTPRVAPDADFSHHLGYVVDLKCEEREAGKNVYYPVRKPARFANQDSGDEVLSEESGEL